MDYARAIRIIRSARGLSQKELSGLLDLNPGYISRIEKGTRVPTLEVLERISDKLDVPMHLLMLLASSDPDSKTNKQIDEFARDLLDILIEKLPAGNAKPAY